MGDMRREMSDMQTELLALRGQQGDSQDQMLGFQITRNASGDADNTITSNTNPNNITLESVQAMIDQALQRNSTSGDASHSSHGDD
ncbi:hypothetical protein Tco_0940040 [Tanacetum coccineum]|uniref:Uncharacterized protein n=1 Tax=Tanacetum coccineum TaxID=301880 RepID=A0ABQ5DLU7_9ASTR